LGWPFLFFDWWGTSATSGLGEDEVIVIAIGDGSAPAPDDG
jgi:hypothetical protein